VVLVQPVPAAVEESWEQREERAPATRARSVPRAAARVLAAAVRVRLPMPAAVARVPAPMPAAAVAAEPVR
jgi:hypothetical protein